MITGELKSKIDKIWDTIWTGCISSPITVLEKITYLMFMKLLDDKEIKKKATLLFLEFSIKARFLRMTIFLLMMTADGMQYHFLNVKKFNFIYHALLTMILIRLREVCRLTAKIL